MRTEQHTLHPNEPTQRAARPSNPAAQGSQGAALVLELERLRRDLDREVRSNQHASRTRCSAPDTSPRPIRTKTSRPKRQKKGKVGRVIDFCLEQVGFKSVVPAQRRREPPDAAPIPTPRHPSPSLAPLPSVVDGFDETRAGNPGSGCHTPIDGARESATQAFGPASAGNDRPALASNWLRRPDRRRGFPAQSPRSGSSE